MKVKKLAGYFLAAVGVTVALSDDVKNNILETVSTDFAAEARAENQNDKGVFDLTIYDYMNGAGVLLLPVGGSLAVSRKKKCSGCDHKL